MPDKSPDKESPPSPLFEEVTGHCYDGSCVLDEWRVVQTAPLLAEHGSQAATLAHVNSGDVLRVHRLLSEVSPVRAEVVHDHDRFLQGDVFYILNGLGARAFLDAGFSERHILEIVLALAVKTLSNYANHLFDTEVDDMFSSYTWHAKA